MVRASLTTARQSSPRPAAAAAAQQRTAARWCHHHHVRRAGGSQRRPASSACGAGSRRPRSADSAGPAERAALPGLCVRPVRSSAKPRRPVRVRDALGKLPFAQRSRSPSCREASVGAGRGRPRWASPVQGASGHAAGDRAVRGGRRRVGSRSSGGSACTLTLVVSSTTSAWRQGAARRWWTHQGRRCRTRRRRRRGQSTSFSPTYRDTVYGDEQSAWMAARSVGVNPIVAMRDALLRRDRSAVQVHMADSLRANVEAGPWPARAWFARHIVQVERLGDHRHLASGAGPFVRRPITMNLDSRQRRQIVQVERLAHTVIGGAHRTTSAGPTATAAGRGPAPHGRARGWRSGRGRFSSAATAAGRPCGPRGGQSADRQPARAQPASRASRLQRTPARRCKTRPDRFRSDTVR